MVVTGITFPRPTPLNAMVFGDTIGGIGPSATSGRNPRRSGELVADTTLGVGIGQTVRLGGRRFRVVGTYDGNTVLGGQPTVVMSIQDACAIAFADQPLATSIVTRGVPATRAARLQGPDAEPGRG